jgi:hypothetical protein
MSKKLIAVAAAAALALTGLVAVPANASISITYNVAASSGAIDGAATPSTTLTAETNATALISVPSNNTLEYTATAKRNSLMKVTVNSTVAGQVVTATTTGALKVVDEPTNTTTKKYTSASGSSNYSVTATTTSVVFYVFTTSTDVGTLTTTSSGNSSVVYIKGGEGNPYNLTATMPSVIPAAAPSTANLIAKVTDVFGNQIKSAVNLTGRVAGAGGVLTPNVDSSVAYNSTLGGHAFTLHAEGTGAMGVDLSITTDPTDVTGLAKASSAWFGSSNAADLAGQITSLTAQLAALKADYNALAARWNKKVDSKRTVKKKVALK